MATIQEVYIALFGRPADPIGYNYYVEATDDGANLDAVGDLSASAEYTARFEGMSNIQMVNQIYMDLFGRDADAAGLTFYVGLLNSGEATQQDIAIRIIDGATGDDAEIIANKVEAAQLFTDSLDTGAEIAAYDGEAAADAGRAYLDGVTGDDATIPTQEEVDAAIAAIEDGDFGVPGDIFTLTANADVIEGTNNDDNIRAFDDAPGAAGGETLQSSDIIEGGAGDDTLNLGDGSFAANVAPVISGVERINNANAASLDLASVAGVNQIWTSVAGGAYTNAMAATTFGVTGGGTASVDFDEDFSGANDSIMLATDNSTGAAAVTSGDAADIEAVTIAALGADATADVLDISAFTDAEEITVTGDSAITLTVAADGDEIVSLDASANTGGVTLDLGTNAADVELIGGSGADNLDSGSGGGDDLLVGGAGNDVLTGGSGNDIFGGGAGVDTINLGGSVTAFGSDEVHVSGGAGGLDTVTGFQVDANAGAVIGDPDVISFLVDGDVEFANSTDDSTRGDSDLDAADYAEYAAIANLEAETDASALDQKVVNVTGASTESAINGLETSVSAEFYAVFTEGGNSSVWYDDDWSDLAGRTQIIEITGATGLDADNFDVYA